MTFGDARTRTYLLGSRGADDGLQAITYPIIPTGWVRARRAACYREEDMGDRLKGKVALVSGVGSSGPGWGNGKATAVLFAREGAKVLAADINLDAALETKRIIGGEGGVCEAVSGDVSRASDVAAIVDAGIAAFGRIDVLHNNVGIVEVGGPVETTEESWDRVNDVNLKSMFLTCKRVLPQMERQGKGAIVNIASVSGIRWLGVPYISYAAPKAAVIQFRGRDGNCWPLPAQIRTCSIKASGSYLGCLTSKRTSGQG